MATACSGPQRVSLIRLPPLHSITGVCNFGRRYTKGIVYILVNTTSTFFTLNTPSPGGAFTYNTPSPHIHAPTPTHPHRHIAYVCQHNSPVHSVQQLGTAQHSCANVTWLILYRESDRGNAQKEGRPLVQQRVGRGGVGWGGVGEFKDKEGGGESKTHNTHVHSDKGIMLKLKRLCKSST